MKTNKIKIGSLKETGLSVLPDLVGFLTPTTITDPQTAIASVGVAIITKKISAFVEEYKQKKKDKEIKDEIDISSGSSFYEVLKFIDENNPDEETLKAIKSIFFRSIKKDSTEQEEFLAYQFLQICKQLTGQDILILKASYEIASKKSKVVGVENILTNSVELWASFLALHLGHKIPELITNREENLVNLGLVSRREINNSSTPTFIASKRFRLTTLGYKLCEYLSLE